MSKLKAVKKRIGSIEKIKKITNAMQVVALTRLRRMEQETLNARFYFDKIRDMLFDIATMTNYNMHPLLAARPHELPMGIIALGSDKGLCGNFNNNVLSGLLEIASKNPGSEIASIAIGKKVVKTLSRRSEFSVIDSYAPIERETINEAVKRTSALFIEKYLNKEINSVYVIYNEFKLQFIGKTKRLRLLPLRLEGVSPERGMAHHRNYIYEPEPREIFTELLKEYMQNQIHQAIFESRAAEEMARMLAMKAATENAQDMIRGLTIQYHKARQAQITKELSEIVSAAEAV